MGDSFQNTCGKTENSFLFPLFPSRQLREHGSCFQDAPCLPLTKFTPVFPRLSPHWVRLFHAGLIIPTFTARNAISFPCFKQHHPVNSSWLCSQTSLALMFDSWLSPGASKAHSNLYVDDAKNQCTPSYLDYGSSKKLDWYSVLVRIPATMSFWESTCSSKYHFIMRWTLFGLWTVPSVLEVWMPEI